MGVHIKTEKQKLPHKNTVRQLLHFISLRPLRVPTVPFRLILPPQKVVFARRICGQAFPGMAVRFAEKSYSAREKAPEGCIGHLFRRFLPILQCFLQKRLYK